MSNSEVFKTLSSINMNALTSQKGKFTYLSWSDAWSELMNYYPDATHDMLEDVHYPDGTMEVRSSITIGGQTLKCFLPVIDHRNVAIVSPDAFAVNKNRMRCLAKNIAMWGLGLYIFRGEDLPVEPLPPAANEEQLKKFNELVAANDGWGLKEFASTVHISVMDSLFNSAPRGEKMDLKARCREAVKIANTGMRVALEDIRVALNEEKIDQVEEIFAEMGDIERKFTMQGLSEIETIQFEKLKQLN